MATKTMTVQSDGFPDKALEVKRNQDSVHFIQAGTDAPTSVTVPSTLFSGGITTCTVDSNASGPNVYQVVGADGDYSVSRPANPRGTANTGTIKVT